MYVMNKKNILIDQEECSNCFYRLIQSVYWNIRKNNEDNVTDIANPKRIVLD